MKDSGIDYTALTVNYNEESVVAIFSGMRPTAGYAIVIISVVNSGDTTTITYGEIMPAEDVMTAQVITHPYIIKVIPKAMEKVVFVKK